jgi:hypothetical protein
MQAVLPAKTQSIKVGEEWSLSIAPPQCSAVLPVKLQFLTVGDAYWFAMPPPKLA